MKKELLILFILVLPAIAPLFQTGFFPIHDNLQPMRQLEMAKCFSDWQIPCRWVANMGLGFGYPLFNYYPPFPYYLGHIPRSLGLSYVDTVKAVGITGFLVTALFMYYLSREFFGDKAGIVGSIAYTYAPYHSVDYYVRGAVNEFWAMAFYPAIFWTSYRLIKTPSSKWLAALSVSLAFLMLSHNLMLMIFTPFFTLWVLFWLIITKRNKSIIQLIPSGLFALGLASFFTIPVLFEQKYVHVETLTVGYFNYLQHFLDLDQLFLRVYWGYGSSGLGQRTMSFALGYLLWIIPVLLVIPAVITKKIKSYLPLLIILYFSLVASLFMTHWKSTFIWQKIPYLSYLQFPWRFLTLSVFFSSFICGAMTKAVWAKWGPAFLLALLLLLNANYFHPREWWSQTTDSQLFSGSSWRTLMAASIYDYLPKSASKPPADPAGSDLNIISGTGSYLTLSKKSHIQTYRINVLSPDAVAQVQTFYFPGWQAWVDGSLVEIDPSVDKLFGRISVPIPYGEHTLTIKFTPTPVRRVSDMISVVSWLLLLGIIISWMSNRPSGILTLLRSKPAP